MSGANTGDTSMLIDENGSIYTLRLRRDNATIRVTFFDEDNQGVWLGDFNTAKEARNCVTHHTPYEYVGDASEHVDPEVLDVMNSLGIKH